LPRHEPIVSRLKGFRCQHFYGSPQIIDSR
jgi:hypothetical protein